jgi:hypothetical protein
MLDGGAAQQALERRYRRLLRCYPPGHREVYREEMLGVLLAAARPGQRAPGARQAANVAACGLAIRARRALSWLGGPWQDALAVVSLITPVLMFILAALTLAAAIRGAVAGHESLRATVPWLSLVLVLGGPAVAMIGWLAVVLLGLTGRRRAAAAIAAIALALAAASLLVGVIQMGGAWSGGLALFLVTAGVGPVFVASLAVSSLTFSAGPQRGLAIVGRRRACLVIAGLSAGLGSSTILLLLSPYVSLAPFPFSLLTVLAIAIAIVLTRGRGTVDRRVSALVATGLLPDLAIIFLPSANVTATLVIQLGSLLFAVLAWAVAIASSGSRRVGRASPAGLRAGPRPTW